MNIQRSVPLSDAQHRLWQWQRVYRRGAEWNVPQAIRIRGELDRKQLINVLQAIVDRHESLRTSFLDVDGSPMQVINSPCPIDVEEADISKYGEGARSELLKAALRREMTEPFDLTQGRLLRVRLLRLANDEHVLLRTVHHIAYDAWSSGIVAQEVTSLYDAFSNGDAVLLKALPMQYADYAVAEHAKWTEDKVNSGLMYWKRRLAGIPECLSLTTDRRRPKAQRFFGGVSYLQLSESETEQLSRVGRSRKATLFVVLLSAFGLLVSAYANKETVVIGTPVANRWNSNLEGLIGCFSKPLPMVVSASVSTRIYDLIDRVRITVLEANSHHYVPFVTLKNEIWPEWRPDISPMFQVAFAMQNAPKASESLTGLNVEAIQPLGFRIRYDLEVHAVQQKAGTKFFWLYNKDLFDKESIASMIDKYYRILRVIAEDADALIDLRLVQTK